MAPTTEVTFTIPTFEGIAAVLAAAYYATVVAHPYIVGFLLMTWSYHPEKPTQAIRYTAWTLPKKCIATVRGWLPSKTTYDIYNPSAGFTTANSSPYGTYTPIGVGGCQLGCCKPNGTPYYTGCYTSSYPSPPPTYGASPPVTPMGSPKLDPYDTYTPARARGCQLGCCNPTPYYNRPYTSSYSSTFPTYGAVPAFTPNAYYGLEKDSELEGRERSGLWKMFGWGLWFCGLAVLIAHGPRSAY